MTAVVFTTLGVNHLIDILDPGSTASSPPSWYIGWGTGGSGTGGTATEGNVDLFAGATNSEGNALGRATATSESQPAAHQLQFKCRLTNNNTSKGFEEVGLFAGTPNGGTSTATSMWVRANYGTITVATDDAVEYTITLSATGG